MPSTALMNRVGAISPVSALILLLSFSLSGVCFWKAVPRSEADSVSASPRASAVDSGPRLKAIERIRVGDRMVGENPIEELDTSLGTQVDAATWRKLTLRAPKQDGSHADVVLLRPQWWLEQRQARAGGTVYIAVPECGIDGNAELLRIEPCPPISPGTGPVVTGTFRHSSADILEVHISGVSEPIGTTANHPFWSEDRNTFLRADELRIGETLRTRAGPAKVLSVTRRTTPAPVYNLEVHGQHVYHVGNPGVLVHNGTGDCFNWADDVVDLEDFRGPRRGPAFDNYRGRFNADRAANGLDRLPSYYDAHHRIPQKYMDHPEFANFDFHHPSNIDGVMGPNAVKEGFSNVNVHQQITNRWEDFGRLHPDATRAQIEAFADVIDLDFGSQWFQ